MSYCSEIKTQFGPMFVTFNDHYILGLFWPSTFEALNLKQNYEFTQNHNLIDELETQLEDYFNGKRQDFEIPIKPEGTEFQKKAWAALLKIPYGLTTSYQEQAQKIGSPKGFRAIGSANSKNPISILIPCHRVISKSGNLSGYVGGQEIKKKLLELEKLNFNSKEL